MKTPCGISNRLSWALADAARTWNRKILMPHVVEPAHPPIAKDKVRYVGEIIAVVIAESLEDAKNAAELVDVNFKEGKWTIYTKDGQLDRIEHWEDGDLIKTSHKILHEKKIKVRKINRN